MRHMLGAVGKDDDLTSGENGNEEQGEAASSGDGVGGGKPAAPVTSAVEETDAPKDEGPISREATDKKAARRALEKPDSTQIEAHSRRGHVPFAPWCAHCRAARATMQPHHGTPQEKK